MMAESRPLVDEYGLYIDGQWVEPGSGRYDVSNPASEQVIATAPNASVAQVEQAIAAARRAFDSGPWPAAEPAVRARCLQQLSDALLARGERVLRDGAGRVGLHSKRAVVPRRGSRR